MAGNEAAQGGPAPRVIALQAQHAGERLDLFLTAELGLSRGQVRRLLERGAVRLDGVGLALRDKGLSLPNEGQIEVDPFQSAGHERIPAPEHAAPMLLAEGPGWLAVDKPPGRPVHPLRADESETVLGHLVERWPQIQGVGEGGRRSGVVHRLDVETSGVQLVATSAEVWARLRAGFSEHRVEKTYRALIAGRLETGSIEDGALRMECALVVAQHRPARVRVARPEEVERGRSRWVRQSVRTLELLGDATLVEVRPETGFLHQIRATLADLGHPLLGDRRYADPATVARAPRHMLHASRIVFEEIDVRAPDAPDFARVLDGLRDESGLVSAPELS